jgi:predicted metal-dependent peptidase
MDQRCAVLKHEVLHVVFRHPTRGKGLHSFLFNIAADLAVNQLCESLPLGALHIADFNAQGYNFAPDGTAEEYYAILAAKADARDWAEKLWNEGSSQLGDHGVWMTDAGEGEGSENQRGNASQGSRPESRSEKAGGGTLDAYSAADWKAGELVLRAADMLRQKNIQAWGSLPAGIHAELRRIEGERAPKVNWKQALRIFVAGSSRSRLGQTMSRPSKRFGTHPGSRIRRQRKVLVAIDTSGSTLEFLELFYAELRHIWKSGVQLHVVECDCSVAAAYPFSGKPPESFHGGGGTAFDPVFDWMRSPEGSRAGPFDGCIYFTDGYASRPERPPLCRLLWVLPPQGRGFLESESSQSEVLQPGTIVQMTG